MIKRFMVIAICVSLARIMAIPANAAYVNDPTCICSIPADRECEYTNAELNMFANTVNGEVGGITGVVRITYADGTEVEEDARMLRMIHARVLDNQVCHELFPDSVSSCLSLYWTAAYTTTGWKSNEQWQRSRDDVLIALATDTNVPNNVLAATCDPHFAERYDGYKLWAKVKWDTGWTHGTFYYYAWEG